MPNQLLKEPFNGKYDSMVPATMLPPGSVSGGENMRKVSFLGGWKPRKGCTLHNTTAAESPSAINSLHDYKNPRSEDYHFIAQCNSKLLDATNDPPASGSTFGTSLDVTVGTTPGFSCIVREDFFYADGSGRPIAWGGDNPYCSGFLAWDNSETAYVDYFRNVTDGRTSTVAVIGNAASDVYYVGSNEIASGIKLDLTVLNTVVTTCKVYSWVAGAWSERSTGFDDGTLDSSKTHAKDGTISWTKSTSDTMSILGGIMAYWYKVEPQAAMTTAVTIAKCQVVRPASPMSNKWNGVYEWIAGCRFYDQSATEYVEALGKVSNESESQNLNIDAATTSDRLYFKTIEPATAIGLGMTTDEQNTAASLINVLEYWDGSAWTTVGTLTDTTKDGAGDSSLSQSGIISWNAAALSPQRRTFEGDQIPGYWYRMGWTTLALSASVSIFMMVYATFPEILPTYDGCVEFKGRLILWGDPEYPNRLRFSALDRPDCFSGSDSGYTDSFGDMKTILCALPFHNELIVFKEDSVYLMEGYNKQTFGIMKIADTVGLASPKTAVVVETGSPTMHSDEPLSIAIWQDVDGIYMTDGRKPRKASGSIERYFNSEYTECIAAASIRNRQAFPDPLNNEYHFLLPTGELVYNYITDEWYPLWNRELDLVTGVALKGTNNRWFVYGGTAGGFVARLENDTTDKNASNTDVKITHSLKTRAISIIQKASVFTEFMLRKLWGEFKESSGNIVTTVFKNMKDTGVVESTPRAMSLTNTGYGIATPGLDLGYKGCTCFQVDFSCSVADQEMEIWTMVYEIGAQGEIVV